MIEVVDSEEEDSSAFAALPSVTQQEYIWPEVSPAHAARYAAEVQVLREQFREEDEEHDSTMVSEYAEDIFAYMDQLEVCYFFALPLIHF